MISETRYYYFIRSGWKGRPQMPLDIGMKFVNTLDALSGIDPIFSDWQIADFHNESSFSLAFARSQIAAIIESNVARNDFGERYPDAGYDAVAMAGIFKDPRSVFFKIDAGGKYASNAELQIGDFIHGVMPDLSVVTYPLFKAALLAINGIWRAPWACAQAIRSGTVAVPIDFGGVQATRIDGVVEAASDPSFPCSIFHIPWIAYLSERLADGITLAPEIRTERTHDGGLLMTATEERFDPANPEHLRRARILAKTLIARTGYSDEYGRPGST
jgi:Immunity protein 52